MRKALRLYETMLLFDGRLSDAEVEAGISRFTTLVADRGGEVTRTERWGRRRLAYEVKGAWEGYYAVLTYRLDPAKLREVNEALRFVEGLLRWKTVLPEVRTRKAS